MLSSNQTPHRQVQSLQMKGFNGFARTCTVYAQQSSAGCNPFMYPLPNLHVHTRFRLIHHHDQITSDIGNLRSPINIRERNLQIGRHISLLVSRFQIDRLQVENTALRQSKILWKADASRNAAQNEILQKWIDDAMEDVKKAEEVRDEICSMLQTEKRKTEAAENRRIIANTSLRSRFEAQMKQADESIRRLHGLLQDKESELTEVKCFAEGLMKENEKLEETVAKFQNGDHMVTSISQQIANALSDLSEVVMVRPDDGGNIEEKLRDLRDCVKDAVKEIKSHRENSLRWSERVHALEEEQLMWPPSERRSETELGP